MASAWHTPALPAKVTRPHAPAALLQRSRLHHRLEGASAGLWIGSPAATGKSTLAAAALETCRQPVLWYQIDRGERDLATFFHYLQQAAAAWPAQRRGRTPPPRFGREIGDDPDDFARAWFRHLFARWPGGVTLVFDDWHWLDEQHPLQRILVNLLGELPAQARVWVLSRDAPTAMFDSLRLRGHLQVLDYRDLALTEAESAALVSAHAPAGRCDALLAQRWHRWCDGWMGALVFALATGRAGPDDLPETGDIATPQSVFGFLAAEIFDAADAGLRDFMLTTAWAPLISLPLAQQCCPHSPVADYLEQLLRRQLLIASSSGRDRSWRYHRLLREFLQQRARGTWSAAALASRLACVAAALETAQMPEAAARVHADAGNWTGLEALLLREAAPLLRAGRHATLVDWGAALPRPHRNPWVDYWLGMAWLAIDPREGHLRHARAYAGFAAAGDAEGLYKSWCGAIEGITYGCDDYGELETWLTRLRELRLRFPRFRSLLLRAQVTVFAFSATFFLRPQAAEFPRWLRGTQRLYRLSLRRADRTAIGGLLGLYHAAISGMAALGAHLHGLRPLLDDPDVPAYPRLVAGLPEVIHHWIAGSTEDALARIEVYTQLAADSGVHAIDRQFAFQRVYVHCLRGELEAAHAQLTGIAGALSGMGQIDVAQFHFLAGWHAVLAGRQVEAVRLLEETVALATRRRFAFFEALGRALLGELLATAGQHTEALAHVERALAQADAIGSVTARVACLMQRTCVAEMASCTSAELRMQLQQAFGLARHHGHWAWGGLNPAPLARLCARALDFGIETDFVRELIRRRGLAAPASAMGSPAWPWAVKLFSFGGLRILRDDVELAFDGKAQRRPLELLKGMLALGGRQVADSQIIDWLWPDAEGDAGQRALITTLQRLRELLGCRRAITHSGGRLALDPASVWFDGWALESCLEQDRLSRCLSLYRGEFLAGEPESWLIGVRERYQSRMLQHLLVAAEQARAAALWHESERLLERALMVDELAEAAYLKLIELHLECEQTVMVARTYERCRRTLAQRAGILPSPRIRALCAPARHTAQRNL